MSAAKSDSLDRMVRILRDRGPLRAGDLGAEMWLRHEQRYNDDAGRRHCRAAGKMLRRAKALGLVRDEQRGPNHLWFANNTPHRSGGAGENHE
jgi:hypothetical protein